MILPVYFICSFVNLGPTCPSYLCTGGGGYGEKCPDGETQEPGQNHLARGSGSKLSKTTLN